VAAFPYPYFPDQPGRYGIFSPSNLFEKGGYLYTFLLLSSGFKEQAPGACLMRTREQDLDDPHSWRAWDGTGFNSRFINPYLDSPEPIRRHICQPVDPDKIGTMQGSIVLTRKLNKYILVGVSAKFDSVRGEDVTGFYYSTSDDLIHWTDKQLMMEVETQQSHLCGDPDVRVYPFAHRPRQPEPQLRDDRQHHLPLLHGLALHPSMHRGNDRDMARIPIQFSP